MMPGLAVREFECALCRRQFTLLSGDLMVPEPDICDECLREIWELEGEALAQHVAGCLASDVSHRDEWTVASVVQTIARHREQWQSADDAIRDREWGRGSPN